MARKEGWNVQVIPPPESAETEAGPRGHGEPIEAFVIRLATAKAAAVVAFGARGLVLACDTLAEIDGIPLGKPKDRKEAYRMLKVLSGRRHRVVTGVCIWNVQESGQLTAVRTDHAVSDLFMSKLSDDFIDRYLETRLWEGKAGACGFQDGHVPLTLVKGSPSNVVGMPIELVRSILATL